MEKENIVLAHRGIRLILTYLNKKEIDYASNVARETKTCYSDVIKKFKELKEKDLIESIENRGKKKPPFIYQNKKIKYHRLTDKGKNIVELLLKIDRELKWKKKSLSEQKKKEIIIKDLKRVLKDNKEFWKDMNTNKPQIALKNAIKYLENGKRK